MSTTSFCTVELSALCDLRGSWKSVLGFFVGLSLVLGLSSGVESQWAPLGFALLLVVTGLVIGPRNVRTVGNAAAGVVAGGLISAVLTVPTAQTELAPGFLAIAVAGWMLRMIQAHRHATQEIATVKEKSDRHRFVLVSGRGELVCLTPEEGPLCGLGTVTLAEDGITFVTDGNGRFHHTANEIEAFELVARDQKLIISMGAPSKHIIVVDSANVGTWTAWLVENNIKRFVAMPSPEPMIVVNNMYEALQNKNPAAV